MIGVTKSFAPNGIADSGTAARPGFSSAYLILNRAVAYENGTFSLPAGVGFI
jgi:hypothetical protein